MGLLKGKTALITGAARGIGKAIALKFASEGANIAFTDLVLNDDMAAGLEATRQEIESVGVTCRAYAGNAADFAETENVVKQIREDFGSIDILVNNAGITKDGLMLRMTEAQWDAVINVNLKSAFNFIHACVPVMMRQRGGSIINMASVVGVHGNAGQANYAASIRTKWSISILFCREERVSCRASFLASGKLHRPERPASLPSPFFIV